MKTITIRLSFLERHELAEALRSRRDSRIELKKLFEKGESEDGVKYPHAIAGYEKDIDFYNYLLGLLDTEN